MSCRVLQNEGTVSLAAGRKVVDEGNGEGSGTPGSTLCPVCWALSFLGGCGDPRSGQQPRVPPPWEVPGEVRGLSTPAEARLHPACFPGLVAEHRHHPHSTQFRCVTWATVPGSLNLRASPRQ